MSLFSSKKRVLAVAALVLLLLFLLRPGAYRLKSRIVLSMSAALGRSVDLSSVHIRLLPRPGFDLENLVVYDDPAFGAEPILRAAEVTADVRLLSLARGKLEIARLDLTEPSLNLVRGESGRWNIEALLERTAHTPLAPTGKAKSEPRPAFPYIEATSARINFKNGQEKKPYTLTNADFSLWQDSENAWGVRLKAQPFRTDLSVNDMGQLRVSGTWQRAAALRDTPLDFSLEWNRAQLGQLTKFLTGYDQGWRGGVQLDATLTGTPANLQIASSTVIDDFRRYDITAGEALRLATVCTGQYHSTDRALQDLACNASVGAGSIQLKGDVGLPGSGKYGLLLTAENVPASAVLALVRHAKKNLPEDLTATGTLHGSATIDGHGVQPQVEGRGEFSDLRLISAMDKTEIGPRTVPFVVKSGKWSGAPKGVHRDLPNLRPPDGARLEFGPVSMSGHAAPKISGWIARSGYEVAVVGESDVARDLNIARLAGLAALRATTEGTAQLDLTVSGSWAAPGNGVAAAFRGPRIVGTAKLKDVRVVVQGGGGPMEIASADLQLLPDRVQVSKLNAKAAGTSWTGSLEVPRGCGTPSTCEGRFDIHTKQLVLSELGAWINPGTKDRPWYRALESTTSGPAPFLAGVRASGRVSVDRLQMQNVGATGVVGKVRLDLGKLEITGLSGDFLGGKSTADVHFNLSAMPADCGGSGTLKGVALARWADAMKDPWIEGTATASYEFSGTCAGGFWQTADAAMRFDVRDGRLPHITLSEPSGIRMKHFSGQAQLHAGKFVVSDAVLDSGSGQFKVSGTVSLRRELGLKLVRETGTGGYAVSGTVAAPRVSASAVEQAKLK